MILQYFAYLFLAAVSAFVVFCAAFSLVPLALLGTCLLRWAVLCAHELDQWWAGDVDSPAEVELNPKMEVLDVRRYKQWTVEDWAVYYRDDPRVIAHDEDVRWNAANPTLPQRVL